MADDQEKPMPVPYEPVAGQAGRPPEPGPGYGGHTGTGPAAPPAGAVTTVQGPATPGMARRPHGARPEPGGHRRDVAAQFFRALRAGWARGIGLLASAVMVAAVVLAVIFAVHILFVVFSANPANSIVEFVNQWAQRLAWRFTSLFTPHSQRVAAVANYGIAAVAYLIAGRLLAGIIRRFA